MRLSCVTRIVLCGYAMMLLASAANAQFKASIQGTVKDATGADVSGATITVTNNETGRSQQVKAGDEGFYRVTELPPGTYTVTAEASGFKKKILESVVIHAEEAQGVNITLETGPVAESVTVTATNEAPLQTENANVSKTITNLEVLRLPQAGRDPYDLVRLAPGVFGEGARTAGGAAANLPNTSGPGGSSISIFQTENQVPVSANGQRVSSNNFQIDGVSVNSQTWGGAAVITPSQESIKELQVTSHTYSDEDGRNSGAQIKVVTKNGTNSFHGSGFFRYAGPSLNAFNKFHGIPGTTRLSAPQRIEQLNRSFGGSLGGPVVKNKLFFFFSYEGFRSSTNNTFQGFVETTQLRQLIRTARPNSLAAKILAEPRIEPRVVSILSRTCADFSFQVLSCHNVAGAF